jgi:ATP-dependent protease ClpP protease subunit
VYNIYQIRMSFKSHSNKRKHDSFDLNWGDHKSKRSKIENNSCNHGVAGIFVIGNEIHFSCGIDKDTIQDIINKMCVLIDDHKNKFKNGDPEDLVITYIVDSPGGSVTSVLKFVDYLNIVRKQHPFVKFHSIVSGMSASAGTIMAIVADKRSITKHAHAMIHELSAGRQSKYTELRSYMNFLDKLHNTLIDIYSQVTKKSREELDVLLRGEPWYSAEEYKKLGFVEEVI